MIRRWKPIVLRVFPALLLLVPASLPAEQGGHDHRAAPHQPRDPQSYMAMLEREDRDAYQKPEEVVEALALKPGMDVADIGAGSGYFTRRLARRVGPEGTVYALDIEEAFLARIREEAAKLGLENVRTVRTAPDRPDLPADSVDMVVLVNTWHHIPNPGDYLEEIHRILRPGGRLVHLDWVKRKTPFGPGLDHRISRKSLLDEMEEAGFRLRSEHFFLPYHYFLIFEEPGDKNEE